MDVFITTKPFETAGKRALARLKPGMRDAVQEGMMRIGICHYMIAFRERRGGDSAPLTVFDFGPVGTDISLPTLGPRLAELVPGAPLILPHLSSLRKGRGAEKLAPAGGGEPDRRSGPPAGPPNHPCGCCAADGPGPGAADSGPAHANPEVGAVLGEVREVSWGELPEGGVHMTHLGTTSMSLEDLRDFSHSFNNMYEVHKNDCRHFVDQCAAAATGTPRASRKAPSQRMLEAGVPAWHQSLWSVASHLVDYQNWAKVKAGCQLTLASVVLTRSPLTPLKLALAPLRVAAIHGGKHMLRGRVRPAVLTGVATLTAGTNTISEAPLVRSALHCASRCFSTGARMVRTASSIAGAPLRACTNLATSAGTPVMRALSRATGMGAPAERAAVSGFARIPCPAATACPTASATRVALGAHQAVAKRASPAPAPVSRGLGAIMADETYLLA